MSHFIKKCSVCGRVIEQCRCPAKDKELTFEVCDSCKEKDKR